MLSLVCRPARTLGSRMQIVSAFKSVEVFSFLVQSKYETRVIECRVLSRHRLNPSKTSFFLSPVDRFASPQPSFPSPPSSTFACFFSNSTSHPQLFLTRYPRSAGGGEGVKVSVAQRLFQQQVSTSFHETPVN